MVSVCFFKRIWGFWVFVSLIEGFVLRVGVGVGVGGQLSTRIMGECY
jgi:hypothetical protein